DVVTLHETAAGISFAVRVQPRAKRNAIIGEVGGALKLAVTAPPIDGRANQACIEFFVNLLDLPRSAVSILSGENNRTKVLRVSGISPETLRSKISGNWG